VIVPPKGLSLLRVPQAGIKPAARLNVLIVIIEVGHTEHAQMCSQFERLTLEAFAIEWKDDPGPTAAKLRRKTADSCLSGSTSDVRRRMPILRIGECVT
jgi:hypothetical protein